MARSPPTPGGGLWDDLGHCRSHNCHFNDWTHASGATNAYAIHQRNYVSWSENNTHENHVFTDCDTWVYTSVSSETGATASMARTRLENLFGSSAKAYAIINNAGMYDSIIRNIKGNGQRIATVLNTNAAIGNSHLEEVKTEQGRTRKSDTGDMSNGSAVLVTAGAQFLDWMAQGMPVTVAGAGQAGADLVTHVVQVISASEVVLAIPASTAVTGSTVTIHETSCYEERGNGHAFTWSKLFNRDGETLFNGNRWTASARYTRSTQFGALNVHDNISAETGTFAGSVAAGALDVAGTVSGAMFEAEGAS